MLTLGYLEEMHGLVQMTMAVRSKARGQVAVQSRQPAAEDPAFYQVCWESSRRNMKLAEPELRERLMKRHAKAGPLSQLHAW